MSESIGYIDLALSMGFTAAAPLDGSAVELKPEICAQCTPETCPNYGKNWICPPGCGELTELYGVISSFSDGVLLQSKYTGIDKNDGEHLKELADEHNRRLEDLRAHIRSEHPETLLLSTGGCNLCESCTYPDEPCRVPDKQKGSLSAHGIDVKELCRKADLDFEFTPLAVTYVGCILFG